MKTYTIGDQVVFKGEAIPELCGITGTVVGSRRIRGHFVYSIRLNVDQDINTLDIPFNSGEILGNVRSSWIEPIDVG